MRRSRDYLRSRRTGLLRHRSRLAIEPLEDRSLLAILTVGATGQFATIQAAVDNAHNNDEIQLDEGSFAENVDLSRLGQTTGSTPANVIFRGTNGQSAIASPNGPAISNSSPLSVNVTFDGITFTSASSSTNTTGIRLEDFQGGLKIIDSVFEELSQSGIVLRDVSADLLIESNTIRNVGNADGEHAIDIAGYSGIGAISFNTIQHAADHGILIENAGLYNAILLINENTITGDSSFFATTDVGIAVKLSGGSIADLSLDRNTMDSLSEVGLKIQVSDVSDANMRWTRNVVSNVGGSIGIDVALDGSDFSETTLVALQNTVVDAQHDGMAIRLSNGASFRGTFRQNAFLTVGDSTGDEGLAVLADSTATGKIDLDLSNNDFTTVTGAGLRFSADGSSEWHAFVNENFFTETNSIDGEAALVIEQTAASSASKIDLQMSANVVFDPVAVAYALHQRGTGSFRLEGTAASAAAQIIASNTGEPVVADGSITLFAVGTMSAELPLIVGDAAWIDVDGDGIKDQSEVGLERVVLRLYVTETGSEDEIIRTTQTDATGAYYFGGLAPGDYVVKIQLPGGFVLTAPEQGSDPQVDSNMTQATASAEVTLAAGASNMTIDAGLLTTWQNPRLKFDVNNDGFTAPGDVLIIINEINRNGARQLTLPAFDATQPPPYYDSNGDGHLTSFDALVIINFLNGVASGEGEGTSGPIWFEDDDDESLLASDEMAAHQEAIDEVLTFESW